MNLADSFHEHGSNIPANFFDFYFFTGFDPFWSIK